MAILSGQRGQSIHALKTAFMRKNDHFVIFRITNKLKTSRPGHHLAELKFKAYPCDRRLFVVTYINAYLDRTDCFRGDDVRQFFVTYGKPNKDASRDCESLDQGCLA